MVMAKGCPYEAATLMLKGGTGLRYIKRNIVAVLQELNKNVGLTIIMVTHNQELARHASRMFEMTAGRMSCID